MSTLTISLPESVRRRVESLAAADGVPVVEYVATLVSQRAALAEVESYVQQRAARGSAAGLLDVLRAAPDEEPSETDRM